MARVRHIFLKQVDMEDIMDLSFFWEIQFIGHFAYSFKYGKWAIILKEQFWAFSQPQSTFQRLDSQKHLSLTSNFLGHQLLLA
jgi:hypothetical protein